MENPDQFEFCAQRLKALADPERLRIVTCLLDGDLNVSELAARLERPVVNISHHLGVLREANLVQTRRQGRSVVYSLPADVRGQAAMSRSEIDLGCCQLQLSWGRPPTGCDSGGCC